MKAKRTKCKGCGEPIYRYEGKMGPPQVYCEACAADRKRERARQGMARLRRQQARA
jgi:formylmethanofuran dehydrogenase subunit E